jgi:hypothetical protein
MSVSTLIYDCYRWTVLIAFGLVFVICPTSLEQRLVNTSTTSNDSDSGARTAGDGLLCAGWEPDAGLVLIRRVTDDGGIVSRSTCECTAVTKFFLDVTDNGAFRTCRDRKDVTNSELSLLPCIDKGARMEALCGDEGLLSELVTVGIAENDTSKGGTSSVHYKLRSCGNLYWNPPASIVNNFLHNTTDVTIALSVIKWTELCRCLIVVGVRFKLFPSSIKVNSVSMNNVA